MVLRGLPFFLAVITIVLHQSVGRLTGTGAIIPVSMSFQRACLTGSLKWKGTGIELCLALETVPSLRWIWAAGPDMIGNTPPLLNVVLANFPGASSYVFLYYLLLWEKEDFGGDLVINLHTCLVWRLLLYVCLLKSSGNFPVVFPHQCRLPC